MEKSMKISELEENSKVINLVAEIDSLEGATQTPSGLDLQEGFLLDDSGQVKFSLWADQVGKFVKGDKIILNGWCKSFNNELQISTGKFGKIAKVPKEKPEE